MHVVKHLILSHFWSEKSLSLFKRIMPNLKDSQIFTAVMKLI